MNVVEETGRTSIEFESLTEFLTYIANELTGEMLRVGLTLTSPCEGNVEGIPRKYKEYHIGIRIALDTPEEVNAKIDAEKELLLARIAELEGAQTTLSQ